MIKYISSDCGSGKTTQIISLVNSTTNRYIIVQNTINLINQTANSITNAKKITTETTNNVLKAVYDFLTNPTHRVLLITDKIFLALKDIDLLKSWTIFIDDVVSFYTTQTYNTDKKYLIEFDIFENFEDVGDNYVSATKRKQIDDDISAKSSELFKNIDVHDYFILNSNFFDKIQGVNGAFTYKNEVNQLNLISWVDISKYKELDITFMSNNFKDTVLYIGNKELFTEGSLENLRKRKTPIEERMNVYYFSKNKRMSKTYRISNQDKVQKVCDYINANLSNFYYTLNNDSKQFFNLNGEFISCDTRGINSFQTYDTCVWLASLKPSPAEIKACELIFNITKDELIKSREYESIYQFVNRSKLRDYNSTEKVDVYVFDKEQAMTLSKNPIYIDLGLDDDIQETKNSIGYEPLNLSRNKEMRLYRVTIEKYPTYNDFNKWMNKKTNQDLTDREREHFWNKWRSL